jgi:hypothetical protein
MLLCFLSLAWHSSTGIPGLLCGLDPAGQVGGGGETLRRFARLQLQRCQEQKCTTLIYALSGVIAARVLGVSRPSVHQRMSIRVV